MDDVASLDRAQKFVDKNYRVPGVADNIDPNKSFWKEYVTYPYPVKYATAKDKRGTSWQIGYMDEYAGTDKDPKVLVIIHGKGAFGGHVRQHHPVCSAQRPARDRTRSAALRHVRARQSRQEPGAHHAGHARGRVRPRGQPARRQEGGLSRPLARWPARDRLRPDLAGSSAEPRARSACRSRRVPARDRDFQGQETAPVRQVLRPRLPQSGSRPGTRPEFWPRRLPGRSRTSATSSISRSAIQ